MGQEANVFQKRIAFHTLSRASFVFIQTLLAAEVIDLSINGSP